MATINAGNWWLPAIKGLLATMLGVLMLVRPMSAVLGLALFIGIFTIIGGLSLVIFGLMNREKRKDWGWLLAEGIFDALIGIAILSYPGLSILLLTSLLGVWLILSGIFQFLYYTRRAKVYAKKEPIVLFNSVITFLLGFIIVFNPLGGVVGLTLMIGIAAILYGLLLVYTAFRLRELDSDLPPLYNEHSIQP